VERKEKQGARPPARRFAARQRPTLGLCCSFSPRNSHTWHARLPPARRRIVCRVPRSRDRGGWAPGLSGHARRAHVGPTRKKRRACGASLSTTLSTLTATARTTQRAAREERAAREARVGARACMFCKGEAKGGATKKSRGRVVARGVEFFCLAVHSRSFLFFFFFVGRARSCRARLPARQSRVGTGQSTTRPEKWESTRTRRPTLPAFHPHTHATMRRRPGIQGLQSGAAARVSLERWGVGACVCD
jgi:hypothetical protein